MVSLMGRIKISAIIFGFLAIVPNQEPDFNFAGEAGFDFK
jgi:hypothetical protein